VRFNQGKGADSIMTGPSASYSRFVQRIRRRYEAELTLLPAGLPRGEQVCELIQTLKQRGRDLPGALRVARHLVLERLAVLDVECGAPMQDITTCMTELAEVTLDLALSEARLQLDSKHGVPRNATGERIDFWVVGMGKLGARELNVSSDIDLIYVYEEDGQTDGEASITAHEYFAHLARKLYAMIGETTEDGQVFRVDLALRPNGNSGPPAVSLAMLEEYLLVQGREWERFAWLKSRIVAPSASQRSGSTLALRSLITPFVYRRYLDYGVFEGLRQLHRKVREEAQRRAAGRPERANDVKLSRGGIREIEFIVQLLLVVRGGQFPEIRTRATLRALEKLAAGGLISQEQSEKLADAYVFLRRLEHRIQFLDDQQTHLLPTADADLAWIAQSMLLPNPSSDRAPACQLLDRLGQVREYVATEFDALLSDGQAPKAAASGDCRGRACGQAPVAVDSEAFAERLPQELAERVKSWSQQARIQNLREDSKLRLAQLIERSAKAVLAGQCKMDAALRFIDWLEPLLRRENYQALLVERPEVQRRLLQLLGTARWPMRYLLRHPSVIDELADNRLVHSRFVTQEFIQELVDRKLAWERSGEAHDESLIDTLRHAHHGELFRTLVRDVEGHMTVEQVADDLSALADATLECTLAWTWKHLKQAHREVPQLAVIAYGKLGGKELGYGSDLDLVFVYDSEGEADPDRAAEIYGAYARKMINWLTLRTPAGELFEIDTALRPNGNSGLLVTSMSAFENYQAGRGNNTAWTWEHQALTRARFCAGARHLGERFEAVRRQVLCMPRNRDDLRTEIQAMREKVRAAHPIPAAFFDVKHSPGGMMDVEFCVQFLVLSESCNYPALLINSGNIALLQTAQDCGLLPPGLGRQAADAYRELRRVQHQARLNERPTQVPPQELEAQRDTVLTLWRVVFG
jgi:glutamate-ammonia-ligase adenylyltransferase